MKQILFALTLTSVFLLQSSASIADVGASRAITPSSVQGSRLPILMGDGWINDASTLATDDPYRFFLSPGQPTAGQKIYHGRARYSVGININRLNRAFFEDMGRMQRLLGNGTQVQSVTLTPFIFNSTVSGIVSIRSTNRMWFFDSANLRGNQNLARAVQGLTRRADTPAAVIVQKSERFNHYFNRAFMVTLLYAGANNQTDVEVVSGVLVDSLPPLVGRSAVSSNSRRNLVNYANILAGENP